MAPNDGGLSSLTAPIYTQAVPPAYYQQHQQKPPAPATNNNTNNTECLYDIHSLYVWGWKPFRKVPNAHPIYNYMRWTVMIMIVAWTLILIGGMAGKMVVEKRGWFTWGKYLTNWTWTYQMVVYILFIISWFDRSGAMLRFLYRVLFWPTRMAIWGVFWMVIPVLKDSPELVTSAFDLVGAGWTLVAERMFHVITFFVIEQMTWLVRNDLQLMLHLKPKYLWLDILQQVVLVHIYVLIYWANNNFESVYHLHELSVWTLFLVFEIFAVGYAGVWSMLMLSPYGQQRGDGLAVSTAEVLYQKLRLDRASNKYKEHCM